LTFDDGPDPAVTPRLLDLLDDAGARATFFVIGRRAEAHPRLTAEIADRGHRVENHTYSHHPTFAFSGPGGLGREIDRAQRAVTALTGRTPVWFRAPAGMRNPLLGGVLARRGLALASWTRRPFDRATREPRRIVGRLTRSLAAGDVLLLHDGGSLTAPSGRPAVLEALPQLLAALAREELLPVPLPPPPAGTDPSPPTPSPPTASPPTPSPPTASPSTASRVSP
jgi:peptidoglycan/xylan/chitin deacetylase (PgdA/CDA1 family)